MSLPLCRPPPRTPAAVAYAAPAGRWILLATVLGSSMAMLDGTIVNVALPAIGEDLDAGIAGLQWTVNGYTLTLAAFILLGGAAGDRFGRRRVFLVGVVGFALASLLCGLAPNIETLVAARALQGVAGALLTPGSLAILQASFAAPTGDGPSAPGPASAASPPPSGRSSAAGWSTSRPGAGSSCSTCRWRWRWWRSPYATCRRAATPRACPAPT